MVKSYRAPLVSVIIPTMDRPQMLERCINSVLLSSYKNLEILVTDDSLTEESKNLVKKIKRRFPKIYYIRNTTQNISIAVNKAIKKSKGEFIFFT
jgi:glycosyltransferase involved in cell wall biosynthesis